MQTCQYQTSSINLVSWFQQEPISKVFSGSGIRTGHALNANISALHLIYSNDAEHIPI